MAKKSHLSWHDIELYLKEKIGKRELVQKKNHYINELNEIKKDLLEYKKDENLYKVEYSLYKDRLEKNREVLEGLQMIFPEDTNLALIIKDLNFLVQIAFYFQRYLLELQLNHTHIFYKFPLNVLELKRLVHSFHNVRHHLRKFLSNWVK